MEARFSRLFHFHLRFLSQVEGWALLFGLVECRIDGSFLATKVPYLIYALGPIRHSYYALFNGWQLPSPQRSVEEGFVV